MRDRIKTLLIGMVTVLIIGAIAYGGWLLWGRNVILYLGVLTLSLLAIYVIGELVRSWLEDR